MFSGEDSIVPLPPPTQLFATVPTVGKLCRCRTRVPPAAMSPVSFCSFSQECQKSDLGRTLETGTLEQERDTQEQEVRAQPKFKPRPKWPEWPSWSLRAQGCSASPTARGYSCHTGTTVLHGEWSCFGKWGAEALGVASGSDLGLCSFGCNSDPPALVRSPCPHRPHSPTGKMTVNEPTNEATENPWCWGRGGGRESACAAVIRRQVGGT